MSPGPITIWWLSAAQSKIDHSLPLDRIAALINQWARQGAPKIRGGGDHFPEGCRSHAYRTG